MKKKYLWTWVGMAALLMGCNGAQTGNQSGEAKDSIVIEHKLGSSKVVEKPARIVALDIGAVETLYELGVTPVGLSKKFVPDYLAEWKNNPDIGDIGSVIEPNFEAINSLQPDVILMSTRQERFYDELNSIAPAIFVGTENADYLTSFHKSTMLIAKIVGKEQEAEEKLKALDAKIVAAQEKYKDNPNKFLLLLYNNGRFSSFGKGSRFGFIFDVLGLKPALPYVEDSVHGQRVSNELIVEANPDYIFIVDRNAAVLGKAANKSEVENKLIQQTKAYKDGKIFYLNPDVWFISGGGLTSVGLMVDDMEKILK